MKLHARFHSDHMWGEVFCISNGFLIKGLTKPNTRLTYRASNPPDSRLSVAGTALPFANSVIAFNPSINTGSVQTDVAGAFEFDIRSPNAYYSCGGRNLIQPSVDIIMDGHLYRVKLSNGYRGRSLSSLPGRPDRAYDR